MNTMWRDERVQALGPADREVVERARRVLLGNIMTPGATSSDPLPWHPNRGICPSPERYRGMWNWDSAFHAVACSYWDPELAREQVRIFLDTQQANGGFMDNIHESGRMRGTSEKPPVMAWAVQRVDRVAPDDAFLATAYERLAANEAFWRRERGGDADGLFHYDSAATDPAVRETEARWESGWDDSVRWDNNIRQIWPVDLNCYMVTMYRALTYMAERLGQAATVWRDREAALTARLETALWDEQVGCYLDFDREAGRFSLVMSPACFMPLFVGIAPRERADRLAALAADRNKFYPGMPTVAYDDPKYEPTAYWRGPTWLNTAYFALKGLHDYGYPVADAMREVMLDWCRRDNSYHEIYDSRSGAGLRTADFGWSAAFAIEFLLNW